MCEKDLNSPSLQLLLKYFPNLFKFFTHLRDHHPLGEIFHFVDEGQGSPNPRRY